MPLENKKNTFFPSTRGMVVPIRNGKKFNFFHYVRGTDLVLRETRPCVSKMTLEKGKNGMVGLSFSF